MRHQHVASTCKERELDTTRQVATLRVLPRILGGLAVRSAEELKRRLRSDRHERVKRGRVLRRQPEALEGIVVEQPP